MKILNYLLNRYRKNRCMQCGSGNVDYDDITNYYMCNVCNMRWV